MKESSGGSEDDEFPDKNESSIAASPTNGNRLNDEENANLSVEGTTINCAPVDKGLHSDENDGGDDCDVVVLKEETKKKKIGGGKKRLSQPGRRSSTRLRGKTPKLTEIVNSSDEEENLESDDDFFEEKEGKRKRVRKPGPAKKTKNNVTPVKYSSEPKSPSKALTKEGKSKKNNDAVNKLPKEFASGSFVILKSDFHSTMTPPIWRIDGKALLQKYVHFDQEGQTLYKNTSTYSGWTTSNKDQYYPAEIEVKSQNRKETIVKFNKETIIADDSD